VPENFDALSAEGKFIMEYYKGRPMIDECEDYVEVYLRPRGEENWDTRHLSVWMDRYSFVSELAKWQVDNYELSEDEILVAVLAWNLTHVKEEAMRKHEIGTMEFEKARYRAITILNKYIQGWSRMQGGFYLMFAISVCFMRPESCDGGFEARCRDLIVKALKPLLSSKKHTKKEFNRIIKSLNNVFEFLSDNPITFGEVKQSVGMKDNTDKSHIQGEAA
jgi:hypothetical protein